MYLGEFICKIDNKNRIIIPSSFRKNLKEIVVTYIDEDTLIIKSKEGWTPESVLKNNTPLKESHLQYILNNSLVIKVDSQGRIVIPTNIMSKLSFKEEALVIGKLDRFIIINKEKYINEINRINSEWKMYLESPEGQNFKKSLIFKKS